MEYPDELLDRRFMAEALQVAGRIPCRPWPNPPVGALVVRDGRVVGRGAHHGAGTAHAEVVALREARDLARGATLYCTLEPCNHHGRTPPCAPEVAAAGISRAVVAMQDPNPAVCGGGLGRLRAAGVDMRVGLMAEDALELVWPFVATRAFERPFVLLKTAASLDGAAAPSAGSSPAGVPFYLTSEEARRDVHRVRRWSDVVLVGERTLAADRPRLDGRLVRPDEPCPAADPLPACADSDLSLDGGWDRPHWVFTVRDGASAARRRAIEQRSGVVVDCDDVAGRVDPRSLVSRFRDLGGHVLLVEGGPTLAQSFLQARLVDRWVSYTAPVVLGGGVRWPDRADRADRAGFSLTRESRIGPDAKVVYDRLSFRQTLAAVTAGRGAG